MKNDKERIRLAIPTIDLLECRKFKGGYYELWGGVLDSSYCYADGPDDYYPDADDGWLPDYNFGDPEEYMEWLDSKDFENDDDRPDEFIISQGDVSGNSEGGQPDEGKSVICDDSVPQEIKDQLDSLLNRLPSAVSDQGVKIMSDPELLDTLAAQWDAEAKGTFLREGYVLPDSTVVQENTVLLGNGADISTVQEELIHAWQINNCFEDGTTTNNSLSAMEFQQTIFDDILTMVENEAPVMGRDEMGGDVYSDFLLDCFLVQEVDEEGTVKCYIDYDMESFNFEYFTEHFNDYYNEWLRFYDGQYYGRGDDKHYDWNWEELLNSRL